MTLKFKEGKKDFRVYTKKERDTFICKKCRFVENEGSGFVEGGHMILNEKDSFEAVEKFCYLGDMLSAGGGQIQRSQPGLPVGGKSSGSWLLF